MYLLIFMLSFLFQKIFLKYHLLPSDFLPIQLSQKSSYALQRAVPHITRAIASNTITNFSGRINEMINPRPKATKIIPFVPECLPIKIPPAMYLLHYTQGRIFCYICVSIIISVPFWTDISP